MGGSATASWEQAAWHVLDELRGTLTPYQAAGHIYRLLALKLLSDIAEEPGAGTRSAFLVPQESRWSTLRDVRSTLGAGLNRACAHLEASNRTLHGLLTSLDFESPVLGHPQQREALLRRLFEMLSSLPRLTFQEVSSGQFGEVCEEFLRRVSAAETHRAPTFLTPSSIAQLLIGLLDPQDGMRVCDPVCGIGGLLTACARHAAHGHPEHGTRGLTLHGQEINLEAWVLCRLNLLLHGLFEARIEPGNVLLAPRLVEQGQLLTYDRVVADPPFNLSEWGAEQAGKDAFKRFTPLPPKNVADHAFVQHCLSILAEGGMAAILGPRGELFRGGPERDIRRSLLESRDCVDAVIGLPGNLLYSTSVAPIVLVLQKGRQHPRRGKVLFIDASQLGITQGRQCMLRPEDITEVVETFRTFGKKEGFAATVPLEAIAQNDWNLNIALYVRQERPREAFVLDGELAAITTAERRRDEAAHRMDMLVAKLQGRLPGR